MFGFHDIPFRSRSQLSRQLSNLVWKLEGRDIGLPGPSRVDEGQDVRIDDVGVGGEHPVRVAVVDLELPLLE